MKKKQADKKVIEKMLDSLTEQRKAPTGVFILLLIVYIASSAVVSAASSTEEMIMIGNATVTLYAFSGIFSAIANICIIFISLYYGKTGFFTAFAALMIQLPLILSNVIVQHNLNSLPGVFGNFLAIVAISVIYHNNKKIEKYQTRLRDQAVTDVLTGLPNRFACNELINELIRRGEKFSVVTIDLNHFKSINDTMGFNVGNQVLIDVAGRWKNIADSGLSETLDFITRLSGDEFALIICRYQSEEDVIATIRQYEAALGKRLTIDDCDFYITASFGYAEYPTDGKSEDVIASCSEAAMHEVKRTNSSNHILRFTPELFKTERILEMEGKIRDALENDLIFFQLQPQFDMSHKLRGFEALARMKDADGQIISPGEFIPVAEKVGLIDKVDGEVFKKAAIFFGELLRKSGSDCILSLNASVRHLMKNDFMDEIRDLLEVSGVPAEQIEIEITESIMIESAEKALRCINMIKEMGIKIAIDDFGTGYSSLSYLNSFPANLLKIDKSFIDKMNTSDSSKQYVAAIISIGHIMGFDVISEGVEEPEQLETLRSIGCDYIQGYIWGRPLMPDAAEKLVMQS